jgi:enediyne biosynthesis protein E4
VLVRRLAALALLAGCHEPPPADPAGSSTDAPTTTTAPPPTSGTGADTTSTPSTSTTTLDPSTSTTTFTATTDPTTTTTDPDSTTADPPAPDTPFVDVTESIGIVAPHVGGGSTTGQAFGDFDRDGHLDLFLTGGIGPNHLYRNLGDGTFASVPLLPGAALPGPAKGGATWADYDNDGWLDLYLAVLGPNVLLRNEGGTLTPVVAGVEHPGESRHSAWADYDGDGRLDLYVINASEPDALYHAEENGTFTDVSALVALPAGKPAFAAVWTDYDDDGDPDLYVANDYQTGNDLWRNDGPDPVSGWRFTNVSAETGAGLLVYGMGIAVGDYDEDLDLDLFVTDIDRTNLLRNELDPALPDAPVTFTEVAAMAGVCHPSVNWGASFLDHDLDGWLDLYLATLHPGPPELTNRLFRNLGDGTFADVSAGCGCDDAGWTWGVAAGDYDADGAVDLVIGNRAAGYRVLRNALGPRPGHHFLTVELEGAPPINRDAIGAHVTVHTTDGRHLLAERKSGSSLGAGDMLPLHFGLGPALVDHVTIRWPDGTTTLHEGVPTDTTWHATYGP